MEPSGLYKRGNILMSKSKRSVNKNFSLAVPIHSHYENSIYDSSKSIILAQFLEILTINRKKNMKSRQLPSRRSRSAWRYFITRYLLANPRASTYPGVRTERWEEAALEQSDEWGSVLDEFKVGKTEAGGQERLLRDSAVQSDIFRQVSEGERGGNREEGIDEEGGSGKLDACLEQEETTGDQWGPWVHESRLGYHCQ